MGWKSGAPPAGHLMWLGKGLNSSAGSSKIFAVRCAHYEPSRADYIWNVKQARYCRFSFTLVKGPVNVN